MKIFAAIAQYLPLVLQGIVAVETALPGADGKTKKEVVLSAIQAGAKFGANVPESHVQAVSAVIDATVGILNTSGVFATTKKVETPK